MTRSITLRARWLLLGAITVLGCESMRPVAGPTPPLPAPPKGKGEFSGDPGGVAPSPVATTLNDSSSPLPSRRAEGREVSPQDDDPLTRVAECLERNDHAGAATNLEVYVRRNPNQPMFRMQLAELYLRADRPADAKYHFERFIADAQTGPPALRAHLVTCHIKLMEIAQRADDRFGEVFQRGVGLLMLVKEQDRAAERDELFCEEMLCKAIRALSEAKELKPGEPRTRVYLAEAHDRAGNRRAANAERAAARTSAVAGELTATERKPILLRE